MPARLCPRRPEALTEKLAIPSVLLYVAPSRCSGRHGPYEDTAFSGRSDYQAFINTGIPAGGLFTGAEEIKTEEQADPIGS